MCDMTLAASVGTEMVGNVVSGISAKARGDAAKAADYASADAAEGAAADAVEKGKLKEMQAAAKGSAIVAEQKLIYSATGADASIGAPKTTQEATEAATEGEKAIVRYGAQMHAYGLKARARADRQRGVNAQAEGDAEMVGSFLGGIAKGGGKVARRFADVAPSADDSAKIEE